MKYAYFMIAFILINIIHTVINLWITWNYRKKEDYAVMITKNGGNKILKIKSSKDHFKYEKGAYIIPSQSNKYSLLVHRKRYFRYIEGVPEPLYWWNDEKPQVPADVFHSIIESNALKLLNTPPLAKNILMWLLIGGAVIVAIILFSGGNG